MNKQTKIKWIKIADIKPYENNAKEHDDTQIMNIATSLEKYGWQNPVLLDKNNVIIAGHGRILGAKELGMTEAPCIYAENLTEQQIKEYRYLDNKLNESEWIDDILELELPEMDLTEFDFGGNDDDDGYEYVDPIQQQFRASNFDRYDEVRIEGRYDMPLLKAVDYKPEKLIGFNYAKSSNEFDTGIHFYLDDYQFERVWNRPDNYLELLKKFDCVLTPAYSIYLDMPEAQKIWNTYRGRLLGQIFQDAGMIVIPTVYWGEEKTYDYCFDGIPKNGTLSTNNILDNTEEAQTIWKDGMDELIKRKNPKRILLYGNNRKIDYDFGDVEVVYYSNEITERLKTYKK